MKSVRRKCNISNGCTSIGNYSLSSVGVYVRLRVFGFRVPRLRVEGLRFRVSGCKVRGSWGFRVQV